VSQSSQARTAKMYFCCLSLEFARAAPRAEFVVFSAVSSRDSGETPSASGHFLQGKLVLLGGWDGSQRLSHVQRFHPGSERWEELPPLREPRASLAAAVVSGKIVVGGYDGGSMLSSVEVFDPAENS